MCVLSRFQFNSPFLNGTEEVGTKSLDFGQGHNGQGKDIIINLSLLLDFDDNIRALVKLLGGGQSTYQEGLAFIFAGEEFSFLAPRTQDF